MQHNDYSHLPFEKRLQIGAGFYQEKIIKHLEKNGIKIQQATDYHTDAILKIDGYIDGDPSKPIQIKHRKIEVKDRNDLAYEICRNFKSNKELEIQLKNTHQQGRDYKGNGIKYYFLLNNSETIIYQLCGDLIKNYIQKAIHELNESRNQGKLNKRFISLDKIEMIHTRDRDPKSFTPQKVMAFIPIDLICINSIKLNDAF